ncbi:MAG: AAA family ATPase [Desulfobacterales bacterium]|nr:AAA family ATPase [Desulfobacterales bacterium]
MKIIDTTVKAFMSFGEEVTQPWNDIGLVLFEGENQAASSASSNGAGKTNLMEAVYWCLFGKTTKGVAADEVVNNILKKDCMVRTRLGNPDTGERWIVTRYRKDSIRGNSLIFEHTDKAGGLLDDVGAIDSDQTQEHIIKFLGASPTLFCNSTYFSQNNIKPFSLFTDKQIKISLMEALDLERFLHAVEMIREDLKVLRRERDMILGKLTRFAEEKSEANERLTRYEGQQTEFESVKAAELEALKLNQKALSDRMKDIEVLEIRRTGLLDKLKGELDATNRFEKLNKDLNDLLVSLDPFSVQARVLGSKHADLHNQFLKKSAEAKNILARIGTNCSECSKVISDVDVDGVLVATQAAATELREKADKASLVMGKASGVLTALNAKKEELGAACDAVEAELAAFDSISREIDGIDIKLKAKPTLDADIKKMADHYEKKSAEKNPFSAFCTKETEAIAGIEERRAALEVVHGKKETEVAYLEELELMFGFSGIPAFLLDSVVPFLNETSNHYATLVCNGEIKIAFSTTSKIKSGKSKGKIREKFAIDVIHTTGAAQYSGISGGERKRADICIAQAMQDLCRSFGRNPLDVVFYDEPFEHLDAAGVAGVTEMLSEVERKIGTVAVVTHNDEMKSMFDKSITVTKGADGFSRLAA